jgi:N-dimethylarginine dimethylaminohydrolase
MYYPKAFSRDSLQSIEKYFSAQNRIEIDEEDAIHFSCNAIVVQNNLILNHASTGLMSKLQSLGFRVVLNPVSEFLKAGGGNKCLALSLSSVGTLQTL